MTSRRFRLTYLALAVLSAGPMAAQPGYADTIIPVDQDRFTSVLLDTDCQGQTIDGESAQGFDPFNSMVWIEQQCAKIPIFAFANANQNSSIGPSSMSAFANAVYSAQSPGSVLASAISNFSVTFELPRASLLRLNGVLLGDGQVLGVETHLELTGPDGTTIFSQTLTGPFPFGEPTEQSIDEVLPLDPGVYTLLGRALAADAVDMADDFIAGESAFNFTVEVSLLGDLNGDSVVGILDLLELLAAWGDCPVKGECSADLNADGTVGIIDLLTLLANWG